MAAGDYKDLQDAVIDRDYGENDRVVIKRFINEAYRDIQASYRWSWTEATAALATVAGTATITLPSDMLFFGRIRPGDSSAPFMKQISNYPPYDYGTINLFNDTSVAQRGLPRMYAIQGNTIEMIPVPDKVYNFKLLYWQAKADLSLDADVPAFSLQDRQSLVYGALWRLAERDRNFFLVQQWKALYDSYVSSMIASDQANTTKPRKAHMPGHYQGLFDRDN